MKNRILVLIVFSLIGWINVKAQCPTTINATVPSSITSNTSYTSGNELDASGDITINTGYSLTLTDCELVMNAGAKITVKIGATLNVIGSHIFCCNDMWQGIVVEQGGIVNILGNGGSSTVYIASLIEDATIAVSLGYDGMGIQSGYNGTNPFLTVDNAIFNRNEVGIFINGLGDLYTTVTGFSNYFSIRNCVFTCRHLFDTDFRITLESLKSSSFTSSTTYPNTPYCYSQPYITNTTYPDDDGASFLKNPYAPYSMKSKAGIKLTNIFFGDDGVTIGSTSGITEDTKVVIFDNQDIGIDADRSQFTVHNCTFQRPNSNFTTPPYYNTNAIGIAINQNSPYDIGSHDHIVKIETPISTCPNNAFFDLQYAIKGIDASSLLINSCDIRSAQNFGQQIANAGNLQYSYNGYRGIDLKNFFFNNLVIENNHIYNVQTGIYLDNQAFSSWDVLEQLVIDNNYIAPTIDNVFADPIAYNDQYVRYGITLTSLLTAKNNENTAAVVCRENLIYNVFNGIYLSDWTNVNSNTDYNTITLLSEPSSDDGNSNPFVQSEYYGIRVEGGVDYGGGGNDNTVTGNSVTGSGDDNVTQIAIDVQQQGNGNLGCNDVRNATHGFRFTGSNNLCKFWNNHMEKTNQYGYTLNNGGIIGTQGSTSTCTSDNSWAGTATDWTSLGHYKTYANLSYANLSTLIVQNTNDLNPTYSSGTANLGSTGFTTFYPYSSTYGITTSSSGSASCHRCNGLGNRLSNPANSNVVEQTIADNTMLQIANATVPVPADDAEQRRYVMQQQLYQQLKANPKLASQNADLQNFIAAKQWTGLDFINNTGHYLAIGDVAIANLLLDLWEPGTQELDNNYYNFYNWIAAMQTTKGWQPNPAAVFALANKCPLKSGTVVFAARNLYNSMTHKINKFSGDCNGSRKIDIVAIQSGKVSIYPNPSNGNFKVVFGKENNSNKLVKVFDVYGKMLFEKKFNATDTEANLDLKVARGLYFVHVQNSNNGNSSIEKVIVQ